MQPGYVLHHWPYRDTSLLVEILTRDYGRIGLVARGAKRSRSRIYGVLQPFIPLIVSWTGRGDLGTLTAAETYGPMASLGGRGMMNGFYVNELLVRLLHRHDPHPKLFEAYIEVLLRLEDLTGDNISGPGLDSETVMNLLEQRALRIFEKNLLRELGYGLVLDHDVVTGQPICQDARYDYHIEKGPIPRVGTTNLPRSGNRDAEVNKHDANDVIDLRGFSLVSLARDELEDELSLQDAKRLMRAALKRYLGDKPLGSRKLFRAYVHANIQQNPDMIEHDNG